MQIKMLAEARQVENKKGIKKIFLLISIFTFLCGFGLFLYPYINGAVLDWKNKTEYQSFLFRQEQQLPTSIENSAPNSTSTSPYEILKSDSIAYNAKIIEEHQLGLKVYADYETPSFVLANYGLPDEIFAVINIPKINLNMPIYLGANDENLSKGATHMSQTSLPIGGTNTNCVIAGHRGWKGAEFFKYLPSLSKGDYVYIINLWEHLTYRVVDKQLIHSTENEYIYIQKNRDLVTLLTCDYGADGTKPRYIVICERVLEP
jgi:sortase A